MHAHWLPSGLVAWLTGKPYIVQLWGTDVELARRVPWLARPILRRARAVVCGSSALAEAGDAAWSVERGADPDGVDVPTESSRPEEPSHVLYAGRLSPEKGIEEFVGATEGLPRVIVGAGPIAVPEALGFVPPGRSARTTSARPSCVCRPGAKGYGFAALHAMAHGRPVVATRVGGLVDLVEDGVTGLVVDRGRAAAPRSRASSRTRSCGSGSEPPGARMRSTSTRGRRRRPRSWRSTQRRT